MAPGAKTSRSSPNLSMVLARSEGFCSIDEEVSVVSGSEKHKRLEFEPVNKHLLWQGGLVEALQDGRGEIGQQLGRGAFCEPLRHSAFEDLRLDARRRPEGDSQDLVGDDCRPNEQLKFLGLGRLGIWALVPVRSLHPATGATSTAPIAKEKQSNQEMKSADSRANMMKFFVGKGR